MFKNWTLWDVARYALILVWLDCVFFGLSNAVMPTFWIMVIGIVVTALIQRSTGQLKTSKEMQQEHIDWVSSEAEANAAMLRQLQREKIEEGAAEIIGMAAASRENNAKAERLRIEADEILTRLHKDD